MKKIFSILFALVAMAGFQSCIVDETDNDFSVNPQTLDATDVTSEGYTLHAVIDYDGGSACTADGGVIYGTKADITMQNCYGKIERSQLRNGKNTISEHVDNMRTIEVFTGLKDYIVQPEATLYYRAYARVYAIDKGDQYIYGDIKSVVIPKK